MRACSVTCVRLFETLRTVAHQAPLSMGFSRQEYWSGLPCPPPGDLPDQGIEPESACISCITGRFFTHWATWETLARNVLSAKSEDYSNKQRPSKGCWVWPWRRHRWPSRDLLYRAVGPDMKPDWGRSYQKWRQSTELRGEKKGREIRCSLEVAAKSKLLC